MRTSLKEKCGNIFPKAVKETVHAQCSAFPYIVKIIYP